MTDTRDPATNRPRTLITGLPLVLLLAGLLLLVTGCAQAQSPSSPGKNEPSKQSQKQASSKTESATTENDTKGKLEHPALGENDAPVVMIEYSDYQ